MVKQKALIIIEDNFLSLKVRAENCLFRKDFTPVEIENFILYNSPGMEDYEKKFLKSFRQFLQDGIDFYNN